MDSTFNFSRLNVNQFMETEAFRDMRSSKMEGSIRLSSGSYKIAWNQRDQAQVSRTDKTWCSSFADFFARGCCSPTRASQLQTELNIERAPDHVPLLAAAPPEIDEDPLGGNFSSQRTENALNIRNLQWANQNAPVTAIRLRGGRDAEQHQELMVTLKDGTLVRISRNDSSDTFQVGARERGGRNLMPTIAESSPANMTLRDVVNAFQAEHRERPYYDQANCQTFAQDVYSKLDPTYSDPRRSEFEDLL